MQSGQIEKIKFIKIINIEQILQVNYQKESNLMRSQNRKLLNQPLKSPSPDVGHRSIIVNTKSPANQIYEYAKMRDNSQSPRRSNMSISFLDQNGIHNQAQIQRLKNIIKDLQDRLEPLQKIRINYADLISQNSRLKQEVLSLKQQIGQNSRYNNLRQGQQTSISPTKLGYNSIVVPSPKASSNTPRMITFNSQLPKNINQNSQYQSKQQNPLNNQNILRQFNERLFKLGQQNKRLMKIIEDNKIKNDNVQMQNYKLKQINNSNYHIQRLKTYFNEQANRMVSQTRNSCEFKVGNVESRLNKLEDAQGRINININTIKKPYRQYSRTNSPFQNTKANLSTDAKTDFLDYHPAQVDMVQSKYTVSPRQTKNFSVDSPIREVQDQNYRFKKQNQILLSRLKILQRDVQTLKKQNIRLQLLSKSRESQQSSSKQKDISKVTKLQKFYQQKAEGLQSQLRNKVAELKFKQRTIQQLQKRVKDANSYIQKQLPCYEKVIEQEKQKNVYYEEELHKEMQKSKQLELKIQYLTQQIAEILQKNKILQQKVYQNQQGKVNIMDFNALLKNYYLRIVAIRENISGQQIQLELSSIGQKLDSSLQFQNILESLVNDYEILAQNFSREKLQKESCIIELQRQNNMLKVQIQQVKIQKQRLKDSIQVFKTPTKQISDKNYKKFLVQHQSKNNDCKIRKLIGDSVQKLSQLQRQIQKKLQGAKSEQY